MIGINNKENCCACGACKSICPKSAIAFMEDEFGNQFPIVNKELCVNCGICEQVCPITNDNVLSQKHITYAVKSTDDKELINSASGGAGYVLGKFFIERMNGVVYGCAWSDCLDAEHIRIENSSELYRIQGSKYVRSTINIYHKIVEDLKERKVLFFGTPCQCAAVKLFTENNPSLYTVEIICHGVIDAGFWRDYVIHLTKKRKANKIVKYDFRNKDISNFVSHYIAHYVGRDSKEYTKDFYEYSSRSYYYSYFLSGKIFRENCYKCSFASASRVGDVTIGDYWGYEGSIPKEKGISVFICNSEKGEELFTISKNNFEFEKKTYEDAARSNEQLNKPYDISKKEYHILKEWNEKGYKHTYRRFIISKINKKIKTALKIR